MVGLEEDNERDEKTDPDGLKVPALVYTWGAGSTTTRSRPRIRCHITLELEKGSPGGRQRWERAFTYDWRFWTLVEILELLEEAGFEAGTVYTEGWDEEDEEGDGDFQPVEEIDNEGSWIAYIVGCQGVERSRGRSQTGPGEARFSTADPGLRRRWAALDVIAAGLWSSS